VLLQAQEVAASDAAHPAPPATFHGAVERHLEAGIGDDDRLFARRHALAQGT
jgi:hypothetical protein